MRIIFMGTPEFAVESLKILIENGYAVVAVVTVPDKPVGRGYQLQSSPVKLLALQHNIPVLQPEKLKDPLFLTQLQSYSADLFIVVAFRMLPEVVWNMPPLGTFNLHASLLPQYRGAAPIHWAIMNGEQETGVTTFFLTHEIDTGKVILQRKIAILPDDNAGTMHRKLMLLGAEVVKETVCLIQKGKATATDQSEFLNRNLPLKQAPKIFKETCQLPLHLSVTDAHHFVRGLSPYPAAWTTLCFSDHTGLLTYKIIESHPEISAHPLAPGTLITDKKSYAKIALHDGFLHLLVLQPPDKKKMTISEYLRGLR